MTACHMTGILLLLTTANTNESVGGCQAGWDGSFHHTKREVFGGKKIHLFEFGVHYLSFGATYLSFGAIYLSLMFMNLHPLRSANCTLFCLEVLFLFRSLITDRRALLCNRRIQDFYRAQIVKLVSFTGAFTSKYVVNSVKEACETVHITPKLICQYATQFD